MSRLEGLPEQVQADDDSIVATHEDSSSMEYAVGDKDRGSLHAMEQTLLAKYFEIRHQSASRGESVLNAEDQKKLVDIGEQIELTRKALLASYSAGHAKEYSRENFEQAEAEVKRLEIRFHDSDPGTGDDPFEFLDNLNVARDELERQKEFARAGAIAEQIKRTLEITPEELRTPFGALTAEELLALRKELYDGEDQYLIEEYGDDQFNDATGEWEDPTIPEPKDRSSITAVEALSEYRIDDIERLRAVAQGYVDNLEGVDRQLERRRAWRSSTMSPKEIAADERFDEERRSSLVAKSASTVGKIALRLMNQMGEDIVSEHARLLEAADKVASEVGPHSDLEKWRDNFSPEQLEKVGRIRDAAQSMLDEYYHQKNETGNASTWMKENGILEEDVENSIEYLGRCAFGTGLEYFKKKWYQPFRLQEGKFGKSLFDGGDKKKSFSTPIYSGRNMSQEEALSKVSIVKALEQRSGVNFEEIFKEADK